MRNPVFLREINTMFRTRKTFIAIGLYGIAMLAIFSLILFNIVFNEYTSFDPKYILYMFCVMGGFQTGVIFLAVPGSTAGAISGERERQTLDLMLMTKMTPYTIVLGKLMSSLLLIILMMVVSMPVYAVLFYYGGVSILDLFCVFIFDITYAMLIGAMSIYFSCVFKKNVTATVVSYLTLIFFPQISAILIGIASVSFTSDVFPVIAIILLSIINPVMSYLSLVDTFLGSNIFREIITSATSDIGIDLPFSIWHITIVLNVVVANFLLRCAAKKLVK